MNTIKIVASITVDPDNGSWSSESGRPILFDFVEPVRFRSSADTGKLLSIGFSQGSTLLTSYPGAVATILYESLDGSYAADGSRFVVTINESGPLVYTTTVEIEVPDSVGFDIAAFDYITYNEKYQTYLYGGGAEGYFVYQTVQFSHNNQLLSTPSSRTVLASYSSERTMRQDITYPQPGQQSDLLEFDVTLPSVQVTGSVHNWLGGGGVGGGGAGVGAGGGIVTTRSVLTRRSRVSITQAVASTPPTPGYWKDVPEPEIQPTVQKMFPFGQGGGGGLPNTYTVTLVPGVGLPVEGGSASDISGATTMAIRLPDGSVQVIRV